MEPGNIATIAVIDDDEDVRDVLGVLLEECGHSVRAYASAPQFLADRNHGDVICVIVDQKMPEMSGLQLLAELDQRGIHVPSLLITGAYDRDTIQGAFHSNAIAVLEKPMAPVQLLQFVTLAANSYPSTEPPIVDLAEYE